MTDLSLSERFALIALNGERSTENMVAKQLKIHCLIAAKLVEFIWEGRIFKANGEYRVNRNAGFADDEAGELVSDFLCGDREKAMPLEQWIRMAARIPWRKCRKVEDCQVRLLHEKGLMDTIPALLECDLNYTTSGIHISAYRSDGEEHRRQVEALRAEVLEEGELTREAEALLWCLEQSVDLKWIFSKEELAQIQNLKNRLSRERTLSGELMKISIGEDMKKSWKQFLDAKRAFARTKFGSGLVFHNSYIQKDESVFIDTEEWGTSPTGRLFQLQERLEEKGHICEVRSFGEVSLIEIDGCLYEAIPDGVSVRYGIIYGVRLRRYLA